MAALSTGVVILWAV